MTEANPKREREETHHEGGGTPQDTEKRRLHEQDPSSRSHDQEPKHETGVTQAAINREADPPA